MPFATTRVELETFILSVVRQKEKEKYHMMPLISGLLIYSTNEPFHRKETHGLGEQTCGCWGWGGGDWDGLGIWG